jgi:hypothetical protein
MSDEHVTKMLDNWRPAMLARVRISLTPSILS